MELVSKIKNQPKSLTVFGTDGIRSIYGKFPLDKETIRYLCHAINLFTINKKRCYNEKSNYCNNLKRLIIGRDTRKSGIEIEQTIAQEFNNLGWQVIYAHIIPTAAISYLIKHNNANIGIMITASHNSHEYNGIKIFNNCGMKLDKSDELKISKILNNILNNNLNNRANNINNISPVKTYNNSFDACYNIFHQKSSYNEYKQHILNIFKKDFIKIKYYLTNKKIIIDCANGSSYKIVKDIFSAISINFKCINSQPDGMNINLNCGTEHLTAIKHEIKNNEAYLGIAFDGDCDRVIFIDNELNIYDGDKLLFIIASYLKKHHKLNKNTIVITHESNLGLDLSLHKQGIKVLRTDIGDKIVTKNMLSQGLNLGGETSGHIIIKDYSVVSDGIISALMILKILAHKNLTLKELLKNYFEVPVTKYNIKVKEKINLKKLPCLNNYLTKLSSDNNITQSVLVRYSGTENLLRILVQGMNKNLNREICNNIIKLYYHDIKRIVTRGGV